MKKHLNILTAAVLSITLLAARAQSGPRGGGGMGGPPTGPSLGGSMVKLFGDNSAFSANLETRMAGGDDGEMTMQGKVAFLDGKSRFEMDMSQTKSAKISAKMVGQMKQMGMDKMVAISRADKRVSYLLYPGMQAYVENAMQDPNAARTAADFKIDVTELGRETVDGHDCVKNKAVVTDGDGKAHESTVWNASDLKKFPVKIVTSEGGKEITLLFKDVQLGPPDAAQFEPPADFKKYDSMMSMMQQEMMKRAGAGRGFAPGQ